MRNEEQQVNEELGMRNEELHSVFSERKPLWTKALQSNANHNYSLLTTHYSLTSKGGTQCVQ